MSWTAPSSGGSAITSYTVTPYIGSSAQTPVTVSGSPPATTATVTGLTNGTSYTFTVSATNAVGTGPASSPSNAVTPGSGSGPSVASATPAAGSSSNPTSTDPSVTFSEAVVTSSVSFTVQGSGGSAVAGSTSFDSTDKVATFTPSGALAAGTTYTVTVSGALDSSGNTMASPYTFTFTTSKAFDAGGQCPCTIWPDTPPAGASDSPDTSSVNLGVTFTPSSNGTITGVRFYKEPDNTGAHTGTLWTAAGAQLATGTFTNESTQGWEELDFSTPVPVTAGTTYVASYHTTTGHYANTANGLASAVTNGPLTAGGRGLRLRLAGHVPGQHLPGDQLLGRRGVLAIVGRDGAGGAVGGVGDCG